MLTSKILAYINPFAWMASLLNISYVKEGDEFIQVLEPVNIYTPTIALIFLILTIICLNKMKSYNLYKD